MENLLTKEPGINVVYTINEPAAAGAYAALKAAGKEKGVLIVSVDGGCPGVDNVKNGVIGATSQQYPLKMASLGVEAVAAFAKSGTKPKVSPGLSFFNTGVELITDSPRPALRRRTSSSAWLPAGVDVLTVRRRTRRRAVTTPSSRDTWGRPPSAVPRSRGTVTGVTHSARHPAPTPPDPPPDSKAPEHP